MLTELAIRNFAIIEEGRVELRPGLNVLTGETGAGKSIVVGAIAALAGGRVRREDLRPGAETALEGRFHLRPAGAVARQLAEQGYALEEGQLLVRRLINREGKSKVFFNGQAAPLGLLQAIGGELLDLSGQHEQQLLLQEERHLDFFDRGLDLEGQREAYAARFRTLEAAQSRLCDLQERQRRLEEQKSFLQFEAREIDALQLRPGEEEELARRREKLQAGEKIRRLAAGVGDQIAEAEGALVPRSRQLAQQLEALSHFEPGLSGDVEKIGELIFYLDDLAGRVQALAGALEADGGSLEEVEDRLHALRRAQRKFGSAEAALQRRQGIAGELQSLAGLGEEIEAAEGEVAQLAGEVGAAAAALSRARLQRREKLEAAVKKGLAALGMKNCAFQAALEPLPAEGGGVAIDGRLHRASGCDQLTFLLSPNPGEPLKRLSKIASGGELSRILLTLKEILGGSAEADGLSVFDEVDAGIGGAVAEQLGKKLSSLAARRQVLCVTHLPQIASLADHHLCVRKSARRGQTEVKLEPLSGAGRRQEIARMLAGEEVGREALAQAEAFLGGKG